MIKAIILDDELRGSNLLAHKLGRFSSAIRVIANFNDPIVALDAIKELKPDVLFLDVEMPNLNGFQFLEHLGAFNFEVIFVTAYHSYTLEALRVNALDYLMKPIDEDELELAISRLIKKTNEREANKKDSPEPANKLIRVALPTAEGVHLVKKAEIVLVEAMNNYSIFHLSGGRKIVISKTLKEFEQKLSDSFFIRINRSNIVNLDYVIKYKRGDGGTLELIDGKEIEVSAQKKEELLAKLF
ncbi:response regulator transcription factor [Pedobacter sp. SD-b]|uniref:Response regulator transcription factor n=1 Tax=Pedobacter segetis TaxID=2793069 RepID=A0ABS1BFV4_9SPHI|nr:LytTR family DNA-binding domain-containing protein [Pedobacter segetis]MBK0381737.1 response regulator transcription factor [Pedobacter segetis]